MFIIHAWNLFILTGFSEYIRSIVQEILQSQHSE